VPVTDLYIFIKIHLETCPMMHVLCTWYSQSPSASSGPVNLILPHTLEKFLGPAAAEQVVVITGSRGVSLLLG
jgi:hypothetical protein